MSHVKVKPFLVKQKNQFVQTVGSKPAKIIKLRKIKSKAKNSNRHKNALKYFVIPSGLLNKDKRMKQTN